MPAKTSGQRRNGQNPREVAHFFSSLIGRAYLLWLLGRIFTELSVQTFPQNVRYNIFKILEWLLASNLEGMFNLKVTCERK
jgi:hypothetical protein